MILLLNKLACVPLQAQHSDKEKERVMSLLGKGRYSGKPAPQHIAPTRKI